MLFVRDESGLRLDLQLADVGFDESAIQRTVEIELEPGRICTVSTHPSEQVDVKQSKNIPVISLHYPTQSYIIHIIFAKKIQIIVWDHPKTLNKEVTTLLLYDNMRQRITFNDISTISPLVTSTQS